MIISKRMNAVFGRHADSWVRVIGGRLFLFIHEHTPTAGGNTRARMTTRNIRVYEIPWDEFETLSDRAVFHHTMRWNTHRHTWISE